MWGAHSGGDRLLSFWQMQGGVHSIYRQRSEMFYISGFCSFLCDGYMIDYDVWWTCDTHCITLIMIWDSSYWQYVVCFLSWWVIPLMYAHVYDISYLCGWIFWFIYAHVYDTRWLCRWLGLCTCGLWMMLLMQVFAWWYDVCICCIYDDLYVWMSSWFIFMYVYVYDGFYMNIFYMQDVMY